MDRSKTKKGSMVALAMVALLGPAVASAELPGEALVCQARATQVEARLLFCASLCVRLEERGRGENAASCMDSCTERYDRARSRLDCAIDRVAFAEVAAVDSETLRCQAREKLADVRELRCLALCQRRPSLDEDPRVDPRRSREACELGCEEDAAARDVACDATDEPADAE
jgi:hypothetical protein